MIKEIIVVEGKDDTTAIRRAVDAETIETGGSAINREIYRKIELAQQRRGVIIFTDPDHAGERLRKLISERIPGCKHAFLTQEEASYKDDIGVENASPDTIRKALANVKTEHESEAAEIHWDHLIAAGLIIHPQAAHRRLEVGKLLGIGYANGKQFHKRCQMFKITLMEFQAALAQFDKRGT
jgi:ribonuclease M5